jgi:uncharacterized protein YdhG (YjbR/CyaY superfamily)
MKEEYTVCEIKLKIKTLVNNGTLYLHAFLSKEGASIDPKSSSYDVESFVHLVHRKISFSHFSKH